MDKAFLFRMQARKARLQREHNERIVLPPLKRQPRTIEMPAMPVGAPMMVPQSGVIMLNHNTRIHNSVFAGKVSE